MKMLRGKTVMVRTEVQRGVGVGGKEGTETGSWRESRVLGAVLSSAGAQPGPGGSNDCLVHLSISCLLEMTYPPGARTKEDQALAPLGLSWHPAASNSF